MFNLYKSEYVLELLDNRKVKMNLKLILLRDIIAVSHITMQKNADIIKVTVALCCININNSDAVKPIQYPKII